MTALDKPYKKVFYIPTRNHLNTVREQIDFSADLILTFDFSVKKATLSMGGDCEYIDKIVSAQEMNPNNFTLQEFIENWNFDQNQLDLFSYGEVEFGQSFQIDFISELYSAIRLAIGFSRLARVSYEQIILVNPEEIITNVLNDLKIEFTSQILEVTNLQESFFFDVNSYMRQSLYKKSIKQKIFLYVKNLLGILYQIRSSKENSFKKTIYIQLYHPTFGILEKFRKSNVVNPLLAPGVNFGSIKEIFKQESIPMYRNKKSHSKYAKSTIENYRKLRTRELVFDDGSNLTNSAYRVIDKYVENKASEAIKIIDSIRKYLEVQSIDLLILVTNYGFFDSILFSVAKNHNIPSYMMINGMLISKYGNDSKRATLINAYGATMARDYFKDCKNVVSLGDPRMDKYASQFQGNTRILETDTFVIGIGTAGLNNTDLVSYSAFEFEFMYECLSAIQLVRDSGKAIEIRLRVRANGVVNMYRRFVREYFPDLKIIFCQNESLVDYFSKLNLYVTFYSQTILEASAMGVPAIYFKVDEEDLHPPFDSKSEVVTAKSRADLFKLMKDFNSDSQVYRNFMDPATLEKYIGFIDGGNLQRNIKAIEGMLET